MTDTIFASATPAIKSGVAIIRLSGPNARKSLTLLTGREDYTPRKASLTKLFSPSNQQLIDEALTVWFPAPHSFTGEDVVEFHTHGSRAVIHEILEELGKIENYRLAEPGEFSRRAFENGKMDLTQAEGLADLIEAQTQMQAKQALRQMQGKLGEHYETWRQQLISILARVEAYIDFPDEEIPADIADDFMARVTALNQEILEHLNDHRRGEKLRHGVCAVIIGAPNTGKSSLLNTLAKREVAIVSAEKGTTRDVIEVNLDLEGYPITLVDTAGLRSTENEIEGEGIRRALEKAEHADLKIALFDASQLPDLDSSTADIIDEQTLIVFNKSDLVSNPSLPSIEGHTPLLLSMTENIGIDALLEVLASRITDMLAFSEDPTITQQRHRHLLMQASESLARFTLEVAAEIAAEELRVAARSLGRITGRIDVEDILDELFSQFCIGK